MSTIAAPRFRRRFPLVVVPAMLAVLLAACAGLSPGAPDASADPVASERPTRTDSSADRAEPTTPAPIVGEVPADIIESILNDAATVTGVAPGQIDITRAEMVTWPDGSLGCPEAGMMYTQALVDGYHVVLDAGGETLDYRVGEGGSFRICEDDGTPSGG